MFENHIPLVLLIVAIVNAIHVLATKSPPNTTEAQRTRSFHLKEEQQEQHLQQQSWKYKQQKVRSDYGDLHRDSFQPLSDESKARGKYSESGEASSPKVSLMLVWIG